MQGRLANQGIDADWEALARDNLSMHLEEDLGRVRGLHRAGWTPEIDLVGIEELEAALAQGRGAILWRMSFACSPVANAALWNAGHPLVHLSHPLHGAARWHGKFWARYIPRLYVTAENRFLRERVLLSESGSFEYLRVLLGRLEANAVVSIFGDISGRQNVEVPVIGQPMSFATGSPSLARRVGCALLPVHVVWLGPQKYRVVIEPAIKVDRALSRNEFGRQAVAEFARRLELRVLEHPASWRNWERHLHPPGSAVATHTPVSSRHGRG
jgi:lauroyl/myristoyl acyltransferase